MFRASRSGNGQTPGLALDARGAAERTLTRYRDSLEGVIVHQDRDSVFTGYAWTGRLLGARVRLSYALRGPKDNLEMETSSVAFKVENRSLILDAESLEELQTIVGGSRWFVRMALSGSTRQPGRRLKERRGPGRSSPPEAAPRPSS